MKIYASGVRWYLCLSMLSISEGGQRAVGGLDRHDSRGERSDEEPHTYLQRTWGSVDIYLEVHYIPAMIP